MKVRQVMTAPAVTVDADASFADIVDLLLANDISGLPVVDSDGALLGIVTEADLVSNEAYGYRRRRALGLVGDYLRGRDPQWVRKAAGRTARELMTASTATASPDESVADAARTMLEGHHKRLPVVEGGVVVGVVSRHDLLMPFGRGEDDIAADVEDALHDLRRVPEGHHADASVAAGIVQLTGTVQWPSDSAVVEAAVASVPGVVAVENLLVAIEPEEPVLKGRLMPPLRH